MLDVPAQSFTAPADNLFAGLPGDFYTKMPPEAVGSHPRLVHANPKAAALIGLDPKVFSDPAFSEIFSGHRPFPGGEPLAMVYSGHQFGAWAGQLGDGRALLLAQIRNAGGELWDVQLKGAGKTPYSRFGDGRAVMRSSIREYLCSEAMAGLGIPTTRALCVIATNETVARETPEPGAVLTRLARSHIRFGHFEHFHHTGKPELVRALADHVIEEYMPADDHAGWFGEVVARTAHLMAQWQAAGFAHGVMNTDNMSILGLTLDYGPFGFLDGYEPGLICNHSDETGRYAFDMQPAIAHWNLRALALSLTSLIPTETLVAALDTYESLFRARYRALVRAKLGLATDHGRADDMLVAGLLNLMAKASADYTLTFRGLAEPGEAWLALFGPVQADATQWLAQYRKRVAEEGDVAAAMNAVNPKYILRNWVAEVAIRAVEDQGDSGPLDRILRLVQSPYDQHPGAEAFAGPPAPEYCGLSVSCSS